MKFLRSVKVCFIMDKIRNDYLRRELEVVPTLNKMEKLQKEMEGPSRKNRF